jgi:hypothetical protein
MIINDDQHQHPPEARVPSPRSRGLNHAPLAQAPICRLTRTPLAMSSDHAAAGAAAAAAASLQEQRATSQEPQLKYERLGGDVAGILETDSASCLKASEKILALGTHTGVIHILDYSGNEVRSGPRARGLAGLAADIRTCRKGAPDAYATAAPCLLPPAAQVKRLQSSTSAVMDISIDRSEEYLASCSQDGVVVVRCSRARWLARSPRRGLAVPRRSSS